MILPTSRRSAQIESKKAVTRPGLARRPALEHPRHLAFRVLACAACVSMSFCAGCYPVPVRFPTRTTDSSSGAVDLSFIKPGSTSRDQVSKKLASIDTGAGQPDFFWGRFRMSKYREIIMVGYIPIGPGDRMWGTENLLITYDQNGLIKNSIIVGDSRVLSQLDLMDTAPTLPLDPSLSVNSVVYWVHPKHELRHEAFAPLTLTAESLECFGMKIPRDQLQKIAVQKTSEFAHFRLKMFLRAKIDFSKTPLRKKTDHLDLAVDAPTLLLLERYAKRTAGAVPPA